MTKLQLMRDREPTSYIVRVTVRDMEYIHLGLDASVSAAANKGDKRAQEAITNNRKNLKDMEFEHNALKVTNLFKQLEKNPFMHKGCVRLCTSCVIFAVLQICGFRIDTVRYAYQTRRHRQRRWVVAPNCGRV
jgi:hypothetical protein